MKKIRLYIPNVLLTFLLVFSLLGTELALFAQNRALSASTFEAVSRQQSLDEKAYAVLESYFQSRSNSTGIPAEIYLNAVDKEQLRSGISASVDSAFRYLDGKEYSFTMDFTALDTSVRTFFETYADENGYAKDAAYEEKVSSAIAEAEAEVLYAADTYRFGTMYEKGWLASARKVISYLNLIAMVLFIVTAVLFLLLIACNLRQPGHLCYWSGLAAFTAGLLLLLPCVYLTATDYFKSFVVKDQQIYAAVVGYLQLLTSKAMTMAIITMVVGVVLFGLFAFFRALEREEHEEQQVDEV